MAETSTLCFSRLSSVPSISCSKQFRTLSSPFAFNPCQFAISCSWSSSRSLLHFVAKANNPGNVSGDDSYGVFPWDEGDTEIQWVPEERVTFFTPDGLIQIGGSMVPHRKKQGKFKTGRKFQHSQESDSMDRNQTLCLGALFDIAATNGLDTGRRFCIFGFCRSIEMLSDVVKDTVLEHGGEVVAAKKASEGGLHEKLTMTVAVPLLWGLPPASETLHLAVISGGGIVEKVYWQWDLV